MPKKEKLEMARIKTTDEALKTNVDVSEQITDLSKLVENKVIDRMVKFDDTMVKVFTHCKRILSIPELGPRQIDQLVE